MNHCIQQAIQLNNWGVEMLLSNHAESSDSCRNNERMIQSFQGAVRCLRDLTISEDDDLPGSVPSTKTKTTTTVTISSSLAPSLACNNHERDSYSHGFYRYSIPFVLTMNQDEADKASAEDMEQIGQQALISAAVLFNMALAYQEQGKINASAQLYQATLTVMSNMEGDAVTAEAEEVCGRIWSVALNNYAICLYELGRTTEAKSLAMQVSVAESERRTVPVHIASEFHLNAALFLELDRRVAAAA